MSKQTSMTHGSCSGPALSLAERRRWVELSDKYPRSRKESAELRELTQKMQKNTCMSDACVWCG